MYLLSLKALALITLVVLPLRWWLKRNERLPAVGRWTRLLALVILSAGLALVISSTREMDRTAGLRSLLPQKACLIKAEIAGGENYRPEIVYRYVIDGTEYTGMSNLHAPGFGGKYKRYEAAKGLIEQYRPGDSIDILYNPSRPTESFLTGWPSWDLYVKLSTDLMMFAAGFMVVLLPRRVQ